MTWSVNNTVSKKSLQGGVGTSLVMITSMTAAFGGMFNSRHATWKGSPGT
jgi:hypothetical protein